MEKEHLAICHFVPRDGDDRLVAINMVQEITPKDQPDFIFSPNAFKLYAVTDGEGIFRTAGGSFSVAAGDIFATFPEKMFAYTAKEGCDFRFAYISFSGSGAKQLLARAGLTYESPVKRGFPEIGEDFLKNIVRIRENFSLCDVLALASLYSAFGRILERKEAEAQVPSAGEKRTRIDDVLSFLDENYNLPELSLEMVAKRFSVNANYLSRSFKDVTGVSFSAYLTTLRIGKACALMEGGLTSVKNVAYLVGFCDPLYFSKIFKKQIGRTPKEHLQYLADEKKRKVHRLEPGDWTRQFYL